MKKKKSKLKEIFFLSYVFVFNNNTQFYWWFGEIIILLYSKMNTYIQDKTHIVPTYINQDHILTWKTFIPFGAVIHAHTAILRKKMEIQRLIAKDIHCNIMHNSMQLEIMFQDEQQNMIHTLKLFLKIRWKGYLLNCINCIISGL